MYSIHLGCSKQKTKNKKTLHVGSYKLERCDYFLSIQINLDDQGLKIQSLMRICYKNKKNRNWFFSWVFFLDIFFLLNIFFFLGHLLGYFFSFSWIFFFLGLFFLPFSFFLDFSLYLQFFFSEHLGKTKINLKMGPIQINLGDHG